MLDFKQWKESEYLDIVVLVENQGKTNPYIFIDERDIVDAKVGSSEYNPDDIMKSKKIINYLPEWLSYFFQGMFLAVIIIVNVAIIIAINKQLKSNTDTIKYANRVTVVIGLISVLISAIPILWMF